MLPDGGRVPKGMAAASSITSARPTSTAGTTGVAGGRRRGVLCQDFGPDGKRRPHKVSSRTKQGIIQAPKKKSEEIDAGLSTSRPCKVEAAAHDWLEHGLPIGAHAEVHRGALAPLLAKISKRRCGTSPPRGCSRSEVAHRRAWFTIRWEPRKQPPDWSAT